jgi:hypothetical protein
VSEVEDLRREVVNGLRRRVDDFQVDERLVDAVCRLPADARDFAFERVFIVAIGGSLGGFYLLPQRLEGRMLVVLNGDWKGEHFASAVAHELAHLMLAHPDPDVGRHAVTHENEAAALVREWGFGGIGSIRIQEVP